jgi:hypothetical protein
MKTNITYHPSKREGSLTPIERMVLHTIKSLMLDEYKKKPEEFEEITITVKQLDVDPDLTVMWVNPSPEGLGVAVAREFGNFIPTMQAIQMNYIKDMKRTSVVVKPFKLQYETVSRVYLTSGK